MPEADTTSPAPAHQILEYAVPEEAGAMPAMNGPDGAKARLSWVFDRAAAGKLPGSVAGAMVRACEAWLRAHDQEVTGARIRAAERTIKALEAELAKVRKGASR